MAEVDYKQAVNLKPDFDYALNALGSIYGSQQKYSEAIIWFQKAVKANPKNSEAWLNLGLVNLQINDIKSACESWQKAEKLGNRNAEIFLEKYCR